MQYILSLYYETQSIETLKMVCKEEIRKEG